MGFDVLMVGNTGMSKTTSINQCLVVAAKVQGHTLWSNVISLSVNMTQGLLDDKRRKGVFGPTAGKQMVIFVDDWSLSSGGENDAQSSIIELLRQLVDQGGWCDRKDLICRRFITHTFVASMGPLEEGYGDATRLWSSLGGSSTLVSSPSNVCFDELSPDRRTFSYRYEGLSTEPPSLVNTQLVFHFIINPR